MQGQLRFEISAHAAAVHIEVRGEVDLVTAPQLLDTILAAALIQESPSVREVVLGFGEVTFLDSSGIAALLHARRRVEDHGQRMRLTNVSHIATKAIELAGVAAQLGIAGHDSRRRIRPEA